MYSALQLAKKYTGHWLSASNSKGHGVHSPFLFHFIKFIKNDKHRYDCYEPIELLRRQLLQDKSFIEVADFGAGSTAIKSSRRRIDKMAASSLKPKRFAQLLFRMVQFYQPQTIVELGTSFGITSAYLASGNTAARLYTMEGAPAIAEIANRHFEQLGMKNIELIEGEFKQTLPELLSQISTVDFAFIDGNHRRKPTLDYFEQLLQKSTPASILVFDDIHWSAEMEEAWKIIKEHPSVTLTIDLFFIGIIFLSKDFTIKQHFSLRF